MEINQFFKPLKDMEDEISKLGYALREAVNANSLEIYRDSEALSLCLQKQGVAAVDIKKTVLVLEASSFLRYLGELSEGISAIDINNIIRSAKESGLMLETIKQVVSDLLYGAGISQKIKKEDIPMLCQESKDCSDESIYITPYAYNRNLDELEKKISKKKKINEEEFSYLNYCCRAGVPRAARILGRLYLLGEYSERDMTKAVEYLKFATYAGDVAAMTMLGDYYYKIGKYNEAYALYTSPGTLANSHQFRRDRVRNLQAIKKYNKKEIILWISLAILIEIVMFFVCSQSLITGKHTVMKVICSILNIGIMGLVIVKEKAAQYTDLRSCGVLFSVIVFLYYLFFILV